MFNDNAVILFQGDSITDCGSSTEEPADFIRGKGYAYMVASELGLKYPEKGYTFLNKGVSGNRIVDVYARWKKDCLNLKPDVLSILEGVNDVGFELGQGTGVDADKFELIYEIMLQEVREKLPDTMLIMMEPFILNHGQVAPIWEKWKPEMTVRREIIKKLAQKYNAIHIPLQDKFNEMSHINGPGYWSYDGIHPTPAGHALIAHEWMKKVL